MKTFLLLELRTPHDTKKQIQENKAFSNFYLVEIVLTLELDLQRCLPTQTILFRIKAWLCPQCELSCRGLGLGEGQGAETQMLCRKCSYFPLRMWAKPWVHAAKKSLCQ